jgi:hypothetical protein
MIIDRLKIDAAASAKFCSRSSVVRALAAGLVYCACVPAFAGHRDRDREAEAGPQRAAQQERREQARQLPVQQQPRQADSMRNDTRQFDPRAFEARAEEHRRMLQARQEQNANSQEAARRGGRLTPDERRDLRRQINEAGIDLYANPKRR